MKDCVFCDESLIKGEITDHLNGVISFEPLNPVTEGHRIFIPKEHADNFWDSPLLFAKVCETIALVSNNEEYNVITSKGKNATQSVFHLHVHLVPRTEGDGLKLPWS